MEAEESYTIYDGAPGPEYDDALRTAIRVIPIPWLGGMTGMSERAIRYIRNDHVTPRAPQRVRLWTAVEQWKLLHLQQTGESR
jgi:hypothetical protein